MAENIFVEEGLSKSEKYAAVLPQLRALMEGEVDEVANLANVAAVLRQVFGFFWVGFYFVKGSELVLGPFQGPVACTRFSVNKGVCGAAASRREPVLVPDVEQFPGHIACSTASRSEVVVPLVSGGRTQLVLDVDSDKVNDFDQDDVQGLEAIMALLRKAHYS